ncbi:MAG: hypothetical protein RQ833_11720, partial [Sphingomonadaceae bacterium]|nr:hypothetical protein [Sphingomonadaceae bacterium]
MSALIVDNDAIALIDRARALNAQGAVIQGAWSRPPREPCGPELLCYRAALGGGPDEPCPSGVAPRWLSDMLPALDDGLAVDRVQPVFDRLTVALRLAAVQHWDAARWERVHIRVRVELVRLAWSYAERVRPADPPAWWLACERACADVIAALESGDSAAAERARAAAEAAAAAWAAAAWAARAAAA